MPDLVNKYPYTNFAGVNLDYILNEIEKIKKADNVQASYLHDIEQANGVITIKNGAGDTVATIDTVQKAIKDDYNHYISGYVYAVSRSHDSIVVNIGNGNHYTMWDPKFLLAVQLSNASSAVMSLDVSESATGTIYADTEVLRSYDSMTLFMNDVEDGQPVKIMVMDYTLNLRNTAYVYYNHPDWQFNIADRSFVLSWETAGDVTNITITRVV